MNLSAPMLCARTAAASSAHRIRLASAELDPNEGEAAAPPAVTDSLPMLQAISQARAVVWGDPGLPAGPIGTETMRKLTATEMFATRSRQAASRASSVALAERDRARETLTAPQPPAPMSADELVAVINEVTDRSAAQFMSFSASSRARPG
jgi:hypothetical protein